MRRASALTGLSLALCLAALPAAADTKDDRSAGEKLRDRVERSKEKLAGDDKQANRDPIRAAQEALRERGYDIGEPDGALGPKTHAAVRTFQKDEGLEVTGRLDAETMRRLEAGKHQNRPGASPPTDGTGSKRR